MKSVAAAGLCVLGVVAAVHAVPALTRWVAPASTPVPAPSPPIRHRAPPSGEAVPALPIPNSASESAVIAPAASAVREPGPPFSAQPPMVRNHSGPATAKVNRADSSPIDSLAREAAMLEEARGLLNRTPGAALSIADRHAAMFPTGTLGIERELLAVQALQRLGRSAEARARGMGLLERARGSIYETRVKAMLEASASP
jgi:hypothetical protein